MSVDRDDPAGAGREPIFNAPWPAILAAALPLAGFALQTLAPPDPVLLRWGFSPIGSLATGHWETLVTAIFLHGSWSHAFWNGAWSLIFATPVARAFGLKGRGLAAFALLYLLGGMLGFLGYAAIRPHAIGPIVGASGAVSALAAAAARIVAGRGRVGSLTSPLVVGLGGGWVIVNLVTAIVGYTPGAGREAVAWEVHLIGFAVGLFLVKPLWRLANPGIDAGMKD